jgi:signal transduction histidine kinase
VAVSWACDGESAALEIVDDGHGFTVDEAGRHDSYGIIGMRERAASIGATLQVDSEPDGGTRLRCSLGDSRARWHRLSSWPGHHRPPTVPSS